MLGECAGDHVFRKPAAPRRTSIPFAAPGVNFLQPLRTKSAKVPVSALVVDERHFPAFGKQYCERLGKRGPIAEPVCSKPASNLPCTGFSPYRVGNQNLARAAGGKISDRNASDESTLLIVAYTSTASPEERQIDNKA